MAGWVPTVHALALARACMHGVPAGRTCTRAQTLLLNDRSFSKLDQCTCIAAGGGALYAAIARVLRRHALAAAGTSNPTRSPRLSRALSGTLAAVSATVGARGARKLAQPTNHPTKSHAFSTLPCPWHPARGHPRRTHAPCGREHVAARATTLCCAQLATPAQLT